MKRMAIRAGLPAGVVSAVVMGTALVRGQTAPATATGSTTRAVNRTDANGNLLRTSKRTGHVSNYDEAKAGTYTLPDPLMMGGGTRVTTAGEWEKRREEILELYRREIYGRVPANVPKVAWEVTSEDKSAMGGTAVKKELMGRFGGEAGSKVKLVMYTPAKAAGRVPMVVCFSFTWTPGASRPGRTAPATAPNPATAPSGAGSMGGDPIAAILAKGWGYSTLVYSDIQPDVATTYGSGVMKAALTAGQEKPAGDEWGAISVWAWGLSRVVDYFETDASVDAKQVAIMGHSRLGKTVLWAGAQDPRIAVVLSSCGGEMGSALSRRDFGETVDDMTENFPWQFAGNFQKYSGHWNEMPVDAHLLISLIAPRPVFIVGGSTDQWADPKGEFLAEVAAGPVYRLLGKKDIDVTEMPGMDMPVTGGDLAFSYHTGGHMISPGDWKAFLEFASRYLHAPGAK